MVEERGTCCPCSEDAEEQESVTVRVIRRKSDVHPDKREFKDSLTALVVVPS